MGSEMCIRDRLIASNALVPTTTPTRSSTSLCGYADPLMNHHSQSQPLSSSLGSQTNTTVSKPTASSHGQVLVGANVINITASPMSVIPQSPGLTTDCDSTPKPFFLKIKTNQVRICQSCRKDYSGPNDTMGLVVARAEKRLVSNLSTGCLLYTSPSPRDATLSRMPSSA